MKPIDLFRAGFWGKSAPKFPAIADNNDTFNDEGDSMTGWDTTNGTLSVADSYLRLTKTAGGTSSSMTKTITFTPANRDFILYGKIRASDNPNDLSAIWFLNGSKEVSFWLGSSYAGGEGSVLVGTASIAGTSGDSTSNRISVGSSLSYSTIAVEFALQFDSKFAQIVCWFRESDGRWKFRGRVACDWFAPSPLSISVLKGSAAPAGSWVEFDYLTLCKPNIVAIGDSICAGATLFNPNRTINLLNDESTWMRHAVLYPELRNNLIVNKGVGSQTSSQIMARISEATREVPRVVFVHASSNDEAASISQASRTTNIQNTVDAVNAAGQKAVLLNAMYGTSGGPDNTPTPDLRNYMTTWWSTHLPTVSGAEISMDIMQPLIDGSGFMQTSLTQSDGIHPTAAGYKAVGEYIASVQYI
jgi:lysophospholipase L1-like esterase